MKRIISIVLVVISLFSLTSCLKSDAAKAVDAMIEALGEISLDSLEAIEQAESAVEQLSEEDRQQLDNVEMLSSARAEYEVQKQADIDARNKALAEIIDGKIERIGKVTLESKKWIDYARSAYDQYDDAVKAFVTKLDVLEAAETDYDKLLAAEFEKEIDQIGEITLEKTELVHTTIEHYNALPERVKKHVHKKAMLDNALEILSTLRAKEVEDLITAIGTVTADSAPAIEAAKKAFANLSEEDAAKVSNKNVLDNIDVVYVDAMIAGLGKITRNSKPAIEKVKEAYKALSAEEKKQVQNKQTLDDADKKYVEACKAYGKSLLKNCWKKHDSVTGVTYYHASTMPHGSSYWYADRRCFILPQIEETSYGSYRMYLTNNYTGSSWVFFEKIIYSVDGKNYTDSVGYFNVTRDNSGGRVWEYYNSYCGNYEIEMLWAIVNSKKTIVRFQGDDYHRDFTVSANDKAAIKNMLIAYEYLTME